MFLLFAVASPPGVAAPAQAPRQVVRTEVRADGTRVQVYEVVPIASPIPPELLPAEAPAPMPAAPVIPPPWPELGPWVLPPPGGVTYGPPARTAWLPPESRTRGGYWWATNRMGGNWWTTQTPRGFIPARPVQSAFHRLGLFR